MAKAAAKYKYYILLQQKNRTWDTIEKFPTNSLYKLSAANDKELKYLKKEYKIAQPNAPLRTVKHKVATRK